VNAKTAPLYLIPFAIGNFLGPLLLGPLFDTIGRRVMIPLTYITSGALLIVTGQLFVNDVLTETTMTIAWCVIFFFASAGASSAYLSVSELFPLEARAMAISLFYAVGTALAALSPTLFGALIESASRTNVNYGYMVGASLMIAAGVIAIFLAVRSVVQNFRVEGASMDPTLHTGQYLLINKVLYARADGTLQFTNQSQDEALIPWTINPVINTPLVFASFPHLAQLPRATAQAEAKGVNALLNFSSRPFRRTRSGAWRRCAR